MGESHMDLFKEHTNLTFGFSYIRVNRIRLVKSNVSCSYLGKWGCPREEHPSPPKVLHLSLTHSLAHIPAFYVGSNSFLQMTLKDMQNHLLEHANEDGDLWCQLEGCTGT